MVRRKPTHRTRLRRLVRVLRGLQRNERLGISTSMLGMVYSGRRNPGRKFLRGVLKAYPQLRDEVHQFLLRDASHGRSQTQR